MRHLIIASMFLLLAACGGNQPIDSQKETGVSAEPWQISMHISGGFAGIAQRIELHHDGTAVVEDEKRNRSEKIMLQADELEQLSALLAHVPKSGADVSKNVRCCDYFQYTLESTRGGDVYRASFDTVDLEALPYVPLVRALTEKLQNTFANN